MNKILMLLISISLSLPHCLGMDSQESLESWNGTPPTELYTCSSLDSNEPSLGSFTPSNTIKAGISGEYLDEPSMPILEALAHKSPIDIIAALSSLSPESLKKLNLEKHTQNTSVLTWWRQQLSSEN